MFDRVSEAAERLARSVSRREFMGRLGRSATVIAAVLGGLCAAPKLAQGGGGGPKLARAACCGNSGVCVAPTPHCVLVSADCSPSGCVWNCRGVLMTAACISGPV
jgi:hypothetical protein